MNVTLSGLQYPRPPRAEAAAVSEQDTLDHAASLRQYMREGV